jgi:hypothetical protein
MKCRRSPVRTYPEALARYAERDHRKLASLQPRLPVVALPVARPMDNASSPQVLAGCAIAEALSRRPAAMAAAGSAVEDWRGGV